MSIGVWQLILLAPPLVAMVALVPILFFKRHRRFWWGTFAVCTTITIVLYGFIFYVLQSAAS